MTRGSASMGGRTTRQCRASIARTTRVVTRAASTWKEIFRRSVPDFVSPAVSCGDLARDVKEYLSKEVSPDPAEQMAFQSIKKLLPPSCRCQESGLLGSLQERLTRPPRSLPQGYLAFVRQQVGRLFPKGWDVGLYERACLVASPPLAGTFDSSRAVGGAFSDWTGKQAEYLDIVLNGKEFLCCKAEDSHYNCRLGRAPLASCPVLRTRRGGWKKANCHCLSCRDSWLFPDGTVRPFALPNPHDVCIPPFSCRAKAIVVQSAGKPRPLTQFSSGTFVLKPLHDAMYDRISKKNWLLRGDVSSAGLNKAGFSVEKGVLVSGDYKSATDNLPVAVAEAILEELLAHSLTVPPNIREYAREILRPVLSYWVGEDREDFEVTVGQMMGSFLSFPLLCIQNFLSFAWARKTYGLRKQCPLQINGDDILFQSTPAFAKHWMDVVSELGLEVERSKTSVSSDYGSVNSTLLAWSGRALVVRHTLRFGMLRPTDHPDSLGVGFRKFLGDLTGDVLFRAGRQFVLWHRTELRGRCLSQLGFRGSLAYRLSVLLRLSVTSLTDVPYPKPPTPHSIHLDPELVTMVPVKICDPEFLGESFREMISWKWSLPWDPVSYEREVLKHCIARTVFRGVTSETFNCLSGLLDERVDCQSMIKVTSDRRENFSVVSVSRPFGSRLSVVNREHLSRLEARERRSRFFLPWSKEEKEVPVFNSVLSTQLTERDTLLPPPYSLEPEIVGAARWNELLCRVVSRHGIRPEDFSCLHDEVSLALVALSES